MKKPQVEFGPSVPGYAHLNELLRQGKLKTGEEVQQQQSRVRKSRDAKKSSDKISPP